MINKKWNMGNINYEFNFKKQKKNFDLRKLFDSKQIRRNIFCCFLLIFLFLTINTFNFSLAKTTNNIERTFEVVKSKNEGYFKVKKTNISVPVNSIKLKGNKILCINSNDMYIFNLDNNYIKKSNVKYNFENKYNTSIVLNNGKVLFVAPLYITPLQKFNDQLKCTYDECGQLPYKEAEKIYLPRIKDNIDLINKYNEYKNHYEHESMYGYIYDPERDTLIQTKGKVNIRRYNTKKILLQDGKVLIYGGWMPRDGGGVITEDAVNARYIAASQMEIYDPEKDEFELIKEQELFRPWYPPILTKDGKVVIFSTNFSNKKKYYTYFDPILLKFSKPKELPDFGGCNYYLPLKNGRVLFFSNVENKFVMKALESHKYFSTIKAKEYYSNWHLADSRYIFLFDSNTEEFSLVGQMAIPRGTDYIASELSDGRILIVGGEKDAATNGRGLFFDPPKKPQKKAEILNIKTGKSIIIGSAYYPYYKKISNMTLLDDGRVLLYGDYNNSDIELYTPKSINKK